MPELPEVETIRIGLARLLPGRTVRAVTFDWPKSFPNVPSDVDQFLVGATVTGVSRRGKVVIIALSTDYSLIIHLKMTGQLIFHAAVPFSEKHTKFSTAVRFGGGHPNDSLVSTLPDTSTRVTISFTDGSKLFFNDMRKFGWVRLLPTDTIDDIPFFKTLGPEPLEPEFTPDVLRARLQRRKNTTIKAALLNQTVLAGVGNIYTDESLWGAKIHPATRVKDLSKQQVTTLHKELVFVLRLSIEKGGSTDKNYVDAEGKRGSYLHFARVFRREGETCPRCGSIIEKTRVAGRGTHYCPACQMLHEPKEST